MAITLDGTNGVTTPDLTVDTDTLTVDTTNNRVGIGTGSPTSALDVTGTVTADGLDVDGNELILDADGDTSITADTDDQIDIKVGGTDSISITPSQITITDADSNQPRLLLKNTNADSSPPFLDFQKDSASPADNDVIGKIRFIGDDDGGNTVAYATIVSTSPDVSDGSENGDLRFETVVDGINAERMRIGSSGNFGIGTHTTSSLQSVNTTDSQFYFTFGFFVAANYNDICGILNRQGNDGSVLLIRQAGTSEGSISVSGTTVSYNGGHLSRWSQLADNTRDESIVKGTVMSNLDQMAEWTTDGVTEENEQLNCMKVSDVEGDANVAGVFVNWDNDDDIYTNDMNIAMTGDMVIRIAQGTTVQRGDLLMSAGDGTAKPQGDDIVRSKTIAKVTSTTVSSTYDDGSYLVPCVLMAC